MYYKMMPYLAPVPQGHDVHRLQKKLKQGLINKSETGLTNKEGLITQTSARVLSQMIELLILPDGCCAVLLYLQLLIT